MSQLKTIAEVSRITGLTSKLINDYHEQGIVKASGYRSRGHTRRDGSEYSGYKVYDEEAVMKFKQIVIFRQLGMQRADIKKRFETQTYDSNRILEEQIQLLNKEKDKIEKKILAVEKMQAIGIKNDALDLVGRLNLEQLGFNTDKWLKSP